MSRPEDKIIPNTKHKGAGHRGRLRGRFLSAGLDGFQDYEVVELLLTLATPRKDCKEAAKAALRRFKTLQAVFEASAEELEEIPGIGPVNVFGIKLVQAVARRYLARKVIGAPSLNNSRELYDYLNASIRDKNREAFLAVFLDAKNRVLGIETLFEGTLNASAVYPREVVLAAIRRNAAALIFAHNHPSGDPRPSAEDLAITRQLVFAAGILGITVHEHLVIGADQYYSFADHGHIARMRTELERHPAPAEPGRMIPLKKTAHMADGKDTEHPDCCGCLDKVFPLGDDGLRQSPEECLKCGLKTECLRAALAGRAGQAVQEEKLERNYRAGAVGFFNRWAQQNISSIAKRTRAFSAA